MIIGMWSMQTRERMSEGKQCIAMKQEKNKKKDYAFVCVCGIA